MRVLLASSWSLHAVHGVTTYCRELERGLVGRGHAVDLLWVDGDPRHSDGRSFAVADIRQYLEQGIAHIAEPLQRVERLRYGLEIGAAKLGLGSYDVIHTQDAIAGRAIARVLPTGVVHVATLHGNLVREFEIGLGAAFDDLHRAYFARLEYLGATSPHLAIVPSHALARQMEMLSGVAQERLRVIRYGMDLEHLREESRSGDPPHATAGRQVLLCPARLSAVKGHTDLIRALDILVRRGADLELWLAGEGEMEAVLRGQVGSLGLTSRVRFLGSRQDVPGLMRESAVVILASTQEVFSYALIEAQALGRPVVATRALGVPEAVEDGATGLLSEPGNPAQLARNVLRILRKPSLGRRLGETGARRASERFALGRMVDEVLAVYQEAAERARTHQPAVPLRPATVLPYGYVIPDPEIWLLPG